MCVCVGGGGGGGHASMSHNTASTQEAAAASPCIAREEEECSSHGQAVAGEAAQDLPGNISSSPDLTLSASSSLDIDWKLFWAAVPCPFGCGACWRGSAMCLGCTCGTGRRYAWRQGPGEVWGGPAGALEAMTPTTQGRGSRLAVQPRGGCARGPGAIPLRCGPQRFMTDRPLLEGQ